MMRQGLLKKLPRNIRFRIIAAMVAEERKMAMKRILICLLIAALTLSLCACAKQAESIQIELDYEPITSLELNLGEDGLKLASLVSPTGAEGEILWSSADETVVVVETLENGRCYLTPVSAGETSVTVSCGKASTSISVVINDPAAAKQAETAAADTSSEMVSVTPVEPEVWYDDNGVKIVCTNYGFDLSNSSYPKLVFEFQVENDAAKTIWAGIDEDYLDGWKIGTGGNICNNGLEPGRKINSKESVYLANKGISQVSVDSVYEFTLWIDLDKDDLHNDRILVTRTLKNIPVFDTGTSPKAFSIPEIDITMPDVSAGLEGPEIWYDNNGVTITCLGYAMDADASSPKLYFDLLVENNSSTDIWAGIHEDYLDGWKIGATGNFCDNGLAAGHRIRSIQKVYLEYSGIEDLSNVQTYEFKLWVDLDKDNSSNPRQEFNFTIPQIPRLA